MKKSYFTSAFLITLLIVQCENVLLAQEAKVFSKYNYYTTENEATVIAEFPASALAGEFSLFVSIGSKQVGQTATAKDNSISVILPLASFDLGKTTLPYTISNKNKIVQKGNIDIIRLRPKANEVKIDLRTGGLIADGLPFFPFGFYCRPAGRLPEQEITHGFNLIAPYQSNLPATYEERKANMDRCAQVGMKVQYSINSLVGSGHNGSRGLDLTEEEKLEILKKEVIAFRDHPALLSWYLNDEPDGQGRPPALLEKAYQLVHELDPYHPVSIVFMLPGKFNLYRNTMDIAMTDPYPVPGPVDIVEQFVKQLNTDFYHEKSIWLVPQAFGGQEMWAREPTAKEIRLMTYLGLINGVKGIQYYTHAPGNQNPQSVSAWSVCSDMAVEVSQMSSFLLSPEKGIPVTTSDSGILARAFVYNNDLLIIAVNKKNKPQLFNLQVNDAENKWSGASASLWFENREVTFPGGSIDDMIDASGTRVYLVKGKSTIDSSKFYPGNLTANPSFEKIVSPGLPIGSNTKRSFTEKTEPGSSFFADPGQSVEGSFSLRLTTATDSNGSKIRLLPIVLKAKNSYSVSIWAKAKAQDRMPSFRMNVEGPRQEKTFILTKDWQRYSFIFRPDSSYSSAIVTFDLLTAGTAWLDMIQVTPDPVISYSINKDGSAQVSIATTMTDAAIKYNPGNELAEAKTNYTQPFLVNKSGMLKAGLFVEGKEIAEASVFIPVNKALGKPVTIETTYAPQYAGSGDMTLTDGAMGSTAFKDKRWLGFSGKDVIATIDMREATVIRSVRVNFLCDPNSGIFLPPILSLLISEDGKDFKPAGTYVNNEIARRGEPYLRSLVIDSKKVKARYIRVVADAFGEIPEGYLFKGTMSWIFIDEVMVD
jgi:hypothetical protein